MIKKVVGGIIAIILLLLVMLIGFCSRQKKPVAATPAAGATATQSAPAPSLLCQGAWDFRTIEIPTEGIPVYLCQGWKPFPLGGKIVITNPEGKPLNDEPGVEKYF